VRSGRSERSFTGRFAFFWPHPAGNIVTVPARWPTSCPNGARAAWEDFEADILDVRTFALLAQTMLPSQFHAFVSLSLLDIDTHLIEIASRRAEKDFACVGKLARDVAILAGNLGAVRSKCIALDSTYHLISELAATLDMARDCMRRLLADDGEADVIEAE
jgi:hypothetical protein